VRSSEGLDNEGLDNERVGTSREADLPPPAPAPHDAGGPSGLDREFPELEEQLRRITAQIEALRPAAELDKVIAGFRSDLADISRQLTEALPRQAVESLCAEVEALARRIDRSRQLSVDLDAIAGIEHGLAEVRDALRGMRTAENLVGLDDALKALAQKLDLIVARQDPIALEQLEAAIGALRGVVSHVASNDALNKVAEDVRGLAAKIDALAKGAVTGHAVSALGARIDALADALNASTEAGQVVPRELEKLLSGLIERLEGARGAAADPATLQRLEERITQLIGRLDVSDARLGNLAAIERGLTDVLAHIDELRGDRSPAATMLSPPGAVDAIARDVAEIKRSELRTQDSLEAVHDTVEQVVGRLAMIESDIHDAGMRAPRGQPGGTVPPGSHAEPEPISAAPEPAADIAAIAAASNATPAPSPGTSLGNGKPAPAMEPADKQDFIAAARRAVQAATASPGEGETHSGSRRRRRRSRSADLGSVQQNRPSRLRKLLVATGIVTVTVGCLQIALHLFQDTRPGAAMPWQRPATPPTVVESNLGTVQPQSGSTQSGPAHAAALPTAPESAPPPQPSEPAAPPAAGAAPDAAASTKPSEPQNSTSETPAIPNSEAVPAPAPAPVSAGAPTPLPAPIVTPPPGPAAGQQSALPIGPEPTGSLAAKPAITATPLPPLPTAVPNSNGPNATVSDPANSLPPTIGGPALRAAALAGDMAAEFEIGVRFAEGRGVAPNAQEAAHWLELAAKQGLAPAQFRLGGYYEKGIGVKKDLAVARDLYIAAAAKGSGKAMHNLAVLYAEGVNGKSDYRAAALWFHRAADRGIIDSQYNLAILYSRGNGVPQDYAEAYKWFALAAKEGDRESASKRDEIAAQLDDATLAAADLVVQNFRPEPQPDDAVRVKAPPGGWDGSPAKPKARTTTAKVAGPDSKPN
jgi:localization factor PodJL